MRLVYQHENRGLVYSVKNILAMHGIECHIKNDHGNTMGAEFGIGNTLLELWVLDDQQFEQAQLIIEKEVLNPPSGKDWICLHCGEKNEGQFAQCWNCQNQIEE